MELQQLMQMVPAVKQMTGAAQPQNMGGAPVEVEESAAEEVTEVEAPAVNTNTTDSVNK